jgi:DNA-binding MarR family transcriptional regulator
MTRSAPLTKRVPKKTKPKRQRKIRLGILDEVVGFNLRLAQDASFRMFAKHSRQPHLRPGRFAMMMVIHENPGLTQTDLGRAIARDKSSVTPLVQELLREGLVTRGVSETDRRRTLLRLTRAGETALKALLVHAMEHDRKLDAIVGSQKALLITLLRKIADELS